MRGETSGENVVEADKYEGNSALPEPSTGQSRPRIATLQSMLKKVSHSPLHNRYNALISSSSDSSGSFLIKSPDDKDVAGPAAAADVGDAHQLNPPQNEASVGLSRTNPFYAHYLDSRSKDGVMEDAEEKASAQASLKSLFAPPPEFQSSPLDLETNSKTSDYGASFWEPEQKADLFQASVKAPSPTANGDLFDTTSKTADYFSTNQTQSQDLWQSNSSKVEAQDLFHAAEGKDSAPTVWANGESLFDEPTTNFIDPFKSPLDKDDLFQSPQTVATNPFYVPTREADLYLNSAVKGDELFSPMGSKGDASEEAPTADDDLFGMSSKENLDPFSNSSTNTVNMIQSPLSRDLFQNVSTLEDPFSPTPTKPSGLLQNGTADIFRRRPSYAKQRGELSGVTPSKALFSTPSSYSPSETKLDFPVSADALRQSKPPPPPVPPKPSLRPQEVVLTTPQGSKHSILQPTPFVQASSPPASPSQPQADPDPVPIFRRPPRPLPRTRPPRPEKPPQPAASVSQQADTQPNIPKTSPTLSFRGPPKPVIRHKPKTPESKPVEHENYIVFEDILLIGQEHAVDDWPEDSPELQPDFKPSGRLRLRRESMKEKLVAGGGSGDDLDGTGNKKKDKKFRMSLLSRRGSKDKFPDDMDSKTSTLPVQRKSSKDYLSSPGENEDEDHYGMDYKKKPLKTKVNKLFRRASTTSVFDGRHENGHFPQDSKEREKKETVRRNSEGAMLDDSPGDEEEGGEAHHEEKRKKKVKIKFVPQRGFAICLEKSGEEPKGAHGYTPRKGSKDKSFDDGAESHGYTPREKFQDDDFEDIEEIKGQTLQSANVAAFVDDEHLQKPRRHHPRPNEDEDAFGIQDHKPKKPTKVKLRHMGRRSSKESMQDGGSAQKKKSSFSAEELDNDELDGFEDCKPNHAQPKAAPRRHHAASGHEAAPHDLFAEDEDSVGLADVYEEEADEVDSCKPKKSLKLKLRKKFKPKRKSSGWEDKDPPGAASSDFMSEAAEAEWRAAQKDERAIADLEDEDEEGDTDSLMEWWYTVEKWDEMPSDEENTVIKQDESKSFTTLADKVHRGLRLFNKVFMERAEVLWQSIIMLHAIADNISNFHHKAKIAGITGGTTTAVGGVAAIAGLALAPFTLGASLVITAVGVGVATAGGITSASAAISDNVNNMHDRKKVEALLKEYEVHLLDIGKILHFTNQGVYKLRGHPFLRSGTQHYSEEWEIRMAVQMISLVDAPVMRATELADTALTSLQGLFRGMDKYFVKDTRELKKGCKKEIVGQIREVANVLNDTIVELNTIREELQDAIGGV
ncbi:uncharacterized protein ACNS7B_021525 isoform 1-T1 [Menidia menidia]